MTDSAYQTRFGSLKNYQKGHVEPIADDVRHYAFSNCFEIANNSQPYEKVVFGQNQIYVLETLRAEGTSPWYTCAHDEFALVMDGEVEVHLVQLDAGQTVRDTEKNGAVLVEGACRAATSRSAPGSLPRCSACPSPTCRRWAAARAPRSRRCWRSATTKWRPSRRAFRLRA